MQDTRCCCSGNARAGQGLLERVFQLIKAVDRCVCAACILRQAGNVGFGAGVHVEADDVDFDVFCAERQLPTEMASIVTAVLFAIGHDDDGAGFA